RDGGRAQPALPRRDARLPSRPTRASPTQSASINALPRDGCDPAQGAARAPHSYDHLLVVGTTPRVTNAASRQMSALHEAPATQVRQVQSAPRATVRVRRLLRLDVLLPHFVSHVPAAHNPIHSRPKMLAPLTLPQLRKLRQHLVRALPLQKLHRSRYGQIRRYPYQRMHMIPVHRTGIDLHLLASGNLAKQLTAP